MLPQNHRAIDVSDQLLLVLLGLVLVHAVVVLILGVSKPILEEHTWRQSQTALSIYWLLHGGSFITYETPALGYPWSIPFEFPIYEWLVASLTLLGLTIEVAGRLVSFAFYGGILIVMKVIFDSLQLSTRQFLITAIVLLCSPLYLYWSRTLMIESCALFFAALWLLFFIRAMKSHKFALFPLIGATLFGLAAVLAKSTTYPAFLALGGLGALRESYIAWRAGNLSARLPVLTGLVAASLIPLVAGVAWVAYSDAVKTLNPFGQEITSSALASWNFGTWRQRFSWNLWGWIVPGRIMADLVGYSSILGLILIIYALRKRYHPAIILGCLFAFLLPIIVFTNLNIIHDYYQYANGIFIIAAIGLALAAVFDSGHYMLGVMALLLLVSGEYTRFYYKFGRYLVANYSDDRRLGLAALAREKTQPGESLLGLGFQGWSPELVYLSQRKGLILPPYTAPVLVARVLDNPQVFLGDYHLGAIAYCKDNYLDGDNLALVNKYLAGRKVLGGVKGCYLVSPSRRESPG